MSEDTGRRVGETKGGEDAGPGTDDAATGAVDAGALFGASVNCEEAVHELYHYLDGELTEVPIGTVMSRIHRGRRALQKALVDVAEARGLVGSVPGG